MASFRWSLISGAILLVAVLIHKIIRGSKEDSQKFSAGRMTNLIVKLTLLNATFVHFFLAEDTEISGEAYQLLAKFVLLYFLIISSVNSKKDFKLLLLIMAIGGSYIGYEVTINDRGSIDANRLEGIGAPGARGANRLASVLATVLPVAGALFMTTPGLGKWVLALFPPFILNVIILCNSRASFLGTIASAIVFLFLSPGPVRKQTICLLLLGGVAAFMLLGDDRIIARFMTTFSEEEERDNSAESRILFWQAGLNVIKDYPFGSGGDGFKKVHAKEYIVALGGPPFGRSVHNGFINETCEWGVQGITLKMLFFVTAVFISGKAAKYQLKLGSTDPVISRISVVSGMCAFLITCGFNDCLDSEWGFWMGALLIAFSRVYGPGADDEGGLKNEGMLVDSPKSGPTTELELMKK